MVSFSKIISNSVIVMLHDWNILLTPNPSILPANIFATRAPVFESRKVDEIPNRNEHNMHKINDLK
jgi:hypothetical protein